MEAIGQTIEEMFKTIERAIECDIHGEQIEKSFGGGKHWTGCPECSKIKQLQRQKDELDKEYADHFKGVGIPAMYEFKTFKDWTVSGAGQAKVINRLMDYADELSKPKTAKNLVLYGVTGSGKTLLAAILLNQIVRAEFSRQPSWNFKFVTSGGFIAEIKDTWNSWSNETESQIINRYGNCAILVLDELGVKDGAKGDQDYLTKLLDMRYGRNMPTIITTNLAGREAVEAMLGDRAYDRINQKSIWASCVWGSYRKHTAQTEDL
jgi:DNA replication protein DnaC